MRLLIAIILLIILPAPVIGQLGKHVQLPEIAFIPHPDQKYGLDCPGIGKPLEYYEKVKIGASGIYYAPFKSVGVKVSEPVRMVIRANKKADLSQLEFRVNDSTELLSFTFLNDTVVDVQLPPKMRKYGVWVRFKEELLGKLNVEVYRSAKEKIRIVKMVDGAIDTEYLEEFLNEIYRQANIKVSIEDVSGYTDNILKKEGLLNNPSSLNDRYTHQMRRLRDRFFDLHPELPKDCYYLFIVPGFVDPELDGYMVRDHAIGFIKWQSEPDMFHAIARELGHGIGMLDHYWQETGIPEGGTLNLMDRNGGSELMAFQWRKLRHPSRSYNFYDGDEDVRTNNGLVAYYFWEEDRNGYIRFPPGSPLLSIFRPFKKNYLSYHLNLSDELFKVVLEWNGILVCVWHLIILGSTVVLWVLVRLITIIKRRRAVEKQGFFKRKIKDWVVNVLIAGIGVAALFAVGFFLKRHEITSGVIPYFSGQSVSEVKNDILYNRNLRYDAVQTARSEILLKKDGQWYMKRRKKVLYFDVYKDPNGQFSKCIFRSDADRLVLKEQSYDKEASSHYMVFSFRDEKDSLESEKVFNHLGVDITNKLTVTDAAKRILIFVNGYRPTSFEHSFEENVRDVQEKGLEFPNSSNLIYNFDRYSYWRPWQKMDLRFIKRLNPTETYYADGHFSVATSNHRSLINFTRLTAQYPERCRNPRKHTCYRTKVLSTGILGDKMKDTYSLLPDDPNRKGYRERFNNGKIAAKNLLLMFNEIPNRSSNDTLYIVAHSMGYAYALGMIEELRGKIHFGGFYIIAPENAGMGRLRSEEWSEVWQYGSKLNKRAKDAPCLQDGIAPQTCARGLDERSRAYFPSGWYRRQGFFDSHFIGNYTWIFDIPEGKTGNIRQR